jgi:sugar-specific transcriptional regulator TrmB
MIVQKEFLSNLKSFGLNSYEAKLWTALLSRGVSTAGELSDIANVPRSRSYDVLESLEKKGFIVMKLGKPIKYIAVPPEEVIDRIKKKTSEEAERQNKTLEALKGSEVLDELNSLYTQGVDLVDPADLTGAVKGRNNLYDHLHSAIKSAEKEVRIMTTDSGLILKAQNLKNSLTKAKNNGAKIKIITTQTKENSEASNQLSAVAQVKSVEDVQSRFCVIDGKQAIMMPLDDKKTHANYDFGIWMNTEFFAASLEKIFDNLWKQAK